MTAQVIQLNPGTGGPKLLTDSLTTVDGLAAPNASEAQFAKMGWGAQSAFNSVTETQPLPAAEPLRATTGLTGAVISTSIAGDAVLVPAVAGQTTRVHRVFFVVAGATNITIKRGATALTGAMPFNAGGSFFLDFDARPHFVTGVNEAFVIGSSNAVQISGRIEYVTGA